MLAAAGTSVVVADVREDRAQSVVAEILRLAGTPQEGRRRIKNDTAALHAAGLRIDVSNPEDARGVVETTLERFGQLDYLVNCAGNAHVGPVVEMPFDAWRSVLDVHLTGTFLCCQAAADAIVASRGRIVSMSSTYAFKGRPNGAHYSAAKAGIVALTKVLAAELAPDVNVNAIAPGPIDTPRWRAGLSDQEYAARRDRRIQDIPLQRMGQPEDIANAALFLLGPRSSWITGSVLHVTGGEFTL
jgi:NAD(P)-dependent dehydrogenase (short-subunit alcohol dehydrogenase family)